MYIEKRRITFERWEIAEKFQQSTEQIGVKKSNNDVTFGLPPTMLRN